MSGIITALEPQKNNADRVSVFLDGEFVFGLPAIEAARLRIGQSLTPDEIEVLREIDAVSRAIDRAVRLLARRPYSVAEIRSNLSRHEIASPVIDRAIARLEELGYVDDHAFARYWIDNRERFKPRGQRALRYELRQKGIADAIIDAALADVDSSDSARRAAEGRVSRWRGLDRAAFRDKLGAYLARRGFNYDIIRGVIDQIMSELETQEPEYFANDESDYNTEE